MKIRCNKLINLFFIIFSPLVFAQTECPSDPTIECDLPVFTSSSSATSGQQSFDAKFIKEQLRLREEKGGDDKRFSAILGTDFTSLDQDTVGKAIGFDSDRTGVFIGLDYRVNDNFWFGTSIDYAREDAQFDQNLRSQDINEYGLSVYSFYDYNEAHVSLLARYADQDYDIEVEKPFFINDMTSGKTDGDRFTLSIEGGYNFDLPSQLRLGINGFLEYDHITVESHQLSGNVGSISFEEDKINRLTSSLGIELSKVTSTTFGVFIPSIFFDWRHEFEDDSRTINGIVFKGTLVESITTVTLEPDRNYFTVGANFMMMFARGFSTYMSYNQDIAHNNIKYWRVNLGGRLEF